MYSMFEHIFFKKKLLFIGKISKDQTCINIAYKHGLSQTCMKCICLIFHRVSSLNFLFCLNLFLLIDKIMTDWRNLITYCYIHNDSTVELSKCGTMIASFEVASSEKIISNFPFKSVILLIFRHFKYIILYF